MDQPTRQAKSSLIFLLELLQTLDTFRSEVYKLIQDRSEVFVGSRISDNDLEFYRSYISRKPSHLNSLLLALFPKLEGNNYRTSLDETVWRRSLRICSPDLFDTYFHLSVPSTSLSQEMFRSVLSLSGDTRSFGQKLCNMATEKGILDVTKAEIFLARLPDYVSEIPSTNITSMVRAFFEIGDQLRIESPNDVGPYYIMMNHIVNSIYGLLMPIQEKQQRLHILLSCLLDNQSKWLPLHLIAALWHQHGKFGPDKPDWEERRLLELEHLSDLEKSVLVYIYEISREDFDTLYNDREFKFFLQVWIELEAETAREWFRTTLNEHYLLDFMRSSEFVIVRYPEDEYQANLDFLSLYLDIDETATRLRQFLNSGQASETEKIVAEVFLNTYENRDNSQSDSPLL